MKRLRLNCSGRSASALTLPELLVTLVLSVLVLGMVLPLLHRLTQPSTQLELRGAPAWQLALQADLAELVSPAKCGVEVFQVIAASDTQPYPQIVLQSFCRTGDARGGAASRGPSEVRYVVESDSTSGALALVRYAKGWHDEATSRHVVADHVAGWSIGGDAIRASAAESDTPVQSPADAPSIGGILRVEVTSTGETRSAMLWVPPLAARLTTAAQPTDSEQPDQGDTP